MELIAAFSNMYEALNGYKYFGIFVHFGNHNPYGGEN